MTSSFWSPWTPAWSAPSASCVRETRIRQPVVIGTQKTIKTDKYDKDLSKVLSLLHHDLAERGEDVS